MTGPFASLGMEVTCGGCKRTYTVTPADGYYTSTIGDGGPGVCFTCLLDRVILLIGPEAAPVMMVNPASDGAP